MNPISMRAAPPAGAQSRDASAIAADLYAEHALALTRLARIMLGDQDAAQDVVHDAFCGLIRRWSRLTDPDRAAAYLRAAVLNGCRDALRRQARRPAAVPLRPDLLGDDPLGTGSAGGADAPLLATEDRRAVLAALRLLPDRQREALVLRYYLELPDADISRVMGIGESSVRSAAHRGLAGLARLLAGETS
jgi:RNA polymerase sigma factor (sigma-70 family)